ncbi:unnamed protein product, partial [Tenebrio molitor]
MFESSDESWKGPVEDQNLFLVWKRIKSRVEKKIISMTSAQNNDNQLTDTESRESISNDENLEPNDEAKFTGNLDLDSFSFPIIIDVQDEIVNISDVNDCDNRIEQENPVIEESFPTPFKKTLFWPEPKKVTLKKKPKEKIPSVATSSQWQQYFKSKEEKKRKEEEKKVQRQEERKRKKMEVEKRKKNKKSDDIYPEQAIDSDDDRSTNNDQLDSNENYRIDDFVVAIYNNQYYPGKIISIKDADQYEVTHMERKGI